MANTTAKTKGGRPKAAETTLIQAEQIPANNEATSDIRVRDIDPDQIVTVKNGFQGRLVYKSKHTGELFVWDEFGAEQDMGLDELKRAKSSSKKFFINNWFMFDEPWIVDYLGMRQYYKYAVKIEDFDKLFELPVDEINDALKNMSDGQKKSVAYRARQMIADGRIDSNKTILVLESSLGVELVDRS